MEINEKEIKKAVMDTRGQVDLCARLYETVEEVFIVGLIDGSKLDDFYTAFDEYITEFFGKEALMRVYAYMDGGACV